EDRAGMTSKQSPEPLTTSMSKPQTPLFDLRGKRIYVAGHRGMVGSAIVRRLRAEDCSILIEDRQSLDLTRQAETERWLERTKPDGLRGAAAPGGGDAPA